MYHLEATTRCELFEIIAEDVWDSIVHNHQAGVERSEVGITDDIVAVVRRHRNLNSNFGVWANPAMHESTLGADIDIFVETQLNQFVYYPLQAKVLKLYGRYEGVQSRRQWEKLKRLEDALGCQTFYLFYNGRGGPLTDFTDGCGHLVSEKQLGCSIVKRLDVESVAATRTQPSYAQIRRYAHPWRELVCCMAHRGSSPTFSINEVRDRVRFYENVVNPALLVPGSNNDQLEGDNIIDAVNASVNRRVDTVAVIRTTAGLAQS